MSNRLEEDTMHGYETFSTAESWEFSRNIKNLTVKLISSDDPFYDSLDWKLMRERVFNYYGKRCMKCRTHTKIIQVDHIHPKALFPSLALSFDNLQVLCKECNKDKGNSVADYRYNNKKFKGPGSKL
jgi:5-methylcytosine-specific restriction endonuclease McrA